ncbi:outer membrane protein [Wenyingzhuangia sp. IMCC45574]
MKKMLLSVLMFTTLIGFSQEKEFESPFKKGRFAIGGTVSFRNNENTRVSQDGIDEIVSKNKNEYSTIRPSFGYFIKDNMVVGASLGYGYSKNSSENEYNNGINLNETNSRFESYSLGGYVKKYYKLYHRFYFYVSGDANFSISDTSDSDSKGKGFSISFNPGLSWVLNKHLAVKVGFDDVLGYRYNSFEFENGDSSGNELFADLGNSTLSVGFRYFL